MLGRQWETRLKLWKENLEKRYMEPYLEVDTEYFTTMEQLAFSEAKNGSFRPIETGSKWGKKWEYGWFHTSFDMPSQLDGKRVVLVLNTASEMLVFVNGKESGSIDRQHGYITLERNAEAGKHYEIYAECYAGHGLRREDAGPVGIDEITVPKDPGLQVTTKQSYIAIWNEDIFQAGMDYLCLYELAFSLPETSLRRMKIIEGLKKFTYIADFELPHDEMVDSIIKAREVLKPLLLCHNGSTAPDFTIFGQSHIDLAWLWHEDETKRKSARTYSNQLVLMEEYPEFKFLMCSPTVLEYVKKYYPDLYDRIKQAVSEKRFIPEGGMWIECDTNIPSGESIIRQFVKGKRWFRQEMGTESVMAWMPDTFGYSGALPQIMKKCKIEYFATQKLLRADPESEQFPYNIFWWKGIDGTRILSHVYKKNNSQFTPRHLIERWEKDRNQEENIDGLIFPFGFGDGGGGCTRTMLEQARRCVDLEGAPRCRMESPVNFFERIDKDSVTNEYVGELYLAWHRGTLTSQSETKRGIRKAEVALHDLEYILSKALIEELIREPEAKALYDETYDAVKNMWDGLLFCEFHDIAPGTSIERVHNDAVALLDGIIKDSKCLMERWNRLLLVSSDNSCRVYLNTTGLTVNHKGRSIAPFSAVTVRKEDGGDAKIKAEKLADGFRIKNSFFACTINNEGLITGLVGIDGREYVKSPWNNFLMFKDVNTDYDAWEIGSMYENMPVKSAKTESCTMEILGGDCIIHIKKKLNNSVLSQDIVIGAETERIDFRTHIDWHERHKILKVSFDTCINATEACEDIQFGYMKRPTHRSKQSDRDRYEVSNQKYTALCDGGHGVAVLNDGKYGVNVHDGDIRLTLLRAPLVPDMSADDGGHDFVYSVYPFIGTMADSKLLSLAYELNNPVKEYEGSSLKNEWSSLFAVDKNNVVIESVFPSDIHSDTVVLRIYEAMGMAVDAEIMLPENTEKPRECDMLLEDEKDLEIIDGRIKLSFGPFEIKTILIKKR